MALEAVLEGVTIRDVVLMFDDINKRLIIEQDCKETLRGVGRD